MRDNQSDVTPKFAKLLCCCFGVIIDIYVHVCMCKCYI